jgi:hypothetical protein
VTNRVLLVVLALFWSTTAHAVWDSYSPFEKGKELTPVALTELTDSKPDTAAVGDAVLISYEFTDNAKKASRISVDWPDTGNAILSLSVGETKQFSGRISGGRVAPVSAYQADLNADGTADYAVFTHSGGSGLAGQITYVSLLLSSPTGYGCVRVLSYDAESADLVNIDGHVYLVHTSMIYGDEGKDGRMHNYWVYNLLRVFGKNLVLDNAPDRRFPKWVMYSSLPNHKETAQLTTEQRQRLWSEHVKQNPEDLGGG